MTKKKTNLQFTSTRMVENLKKKISKIGKNIYVYQATSASSEEVFYYWKLLKLTSIFVYKDKIKQLIKIVV